MKISKRLAMAVMMLSLVCFIAAPTLAGDPAGPNSTGNPMHGDDWGGGCAGEGNYGSGQHPVGPNDGIGLMMPLIIVSVY